MNRNDIVSMIWGVIQQIEHINQTKTDLPALEVADDDMIWVMQKKQQIKMILLVWSEIKLTINEHIISKRDRLTCCRSSRDDTI